MPRVTSPAREEVEIGFVLSHVCLVFQGRGGLRWGLEDLGYARVGTQISVSHSVAWGRECNSYFVLY